MAVGTRVGHGAGCAGELGGGDDLHCLCDLFDVADGFEAAFDFSEGGVGCGILGSENCWPVDYGRSMLATWVSDVYIWATATVVMSRSISYSLRVAL